MIDVGKPKGNPNEAAMGLEWGNDGKTLRMFGTPFDITEHKQVEAALRESEQALRTILDNAHDAIFVHAVDGRILDVNRKMLELYGVTREQALQASITVDFSTLDNPLDQLEDRWERVLAGESLLFEWKAKRPNDGTSFDVEVALKKIIVGSRPVLLANVRDISRRKATAAILQENEEKFRAVVENSVDAIMRFDRQHRHLYVNPIVEKETGVPAAEIIGKTHEELGFPETLCSLWGKAIEQVFHSGEVYRIEFQRPNGLWIDWMLIPERDESGQVKAVITSSRDITTRKQTEAELRESEKRFRDLSEMLPEVVFETDQNLNLTYANQRAFELFGYSPKELKALNSFDVIAPEDRDRAKTNISMRVKGIDPGKTEYQALRKDGSTFPILLHAGTIIKDEEIVGFRGVIVDLTERKAAEEEKACLESQIHQVQKLDSIGRLAGGVAHDLNNMLSPILGYGELLLDDFSPDDQRRENIDQILGAGYRARDLVRQLLAFSRKQTLEYKTLNLNKTIRDFESLLRRTIREDIDLEIISSPDIRTITADIGQIMQVIMNLSLNAQDAMPDGGILTFETALVELDAGYVADHPGSKVGQYVMLAVSDTGCGMDEETREHIFEPFFSTKGDKGTGLGLATVYGIVKQHEGNIWVDSEPERGTTFKVYLPVAGVKQVEIKNDEKKPVAELEGSETILVVEDNVQVRQLTDNILKRQGYKPLLAGSGSEALTILASHNRPVDLLLTDVVMPDINGKELFLQVAEKYPDIRVLYMSGYTNDVIAHRGILDEGVRFIQKPFTIQGLSAKIREVLAQN